MFVSAFFSTSVCVPCSSTVSYNVSRLENCGDESTPSQHKYRKNFKLNNRAISDFPDTRHIFKPLLNAVLYFHELKKISATFIRNVWFSVSNITQSFRLRIVFKMLKSENCLWRFSTKFGFSFQLSHKIFRLQFSLIF